MSDFFSPAAERNKEPILRLLQPHLEKLDRLLEIGSGTGQHAVYFAGQYPGILWQTSDLPANLAQLAMALRQSELANLPSPWMIDVNDPPVQHDFPAIYTANTLHIMSEGSVEQFFRYTNKALARSAQLFIYGPFNRNGEFTSESNQQFDASLRSRGVGSGIRDREWIIELAAEIGLQLDELAAMPANNIMMTFSRGLAEGSV